jgi:hypothetical protein
MVLKIEEERLQEMDIETLYSILKDLLEDDPENSELKEVVDKVKNGIKLGFPIRAVIDGYAEEYPSRRMVRIIGINRFGLYPYKDELDERKSLARRTIRRYLQLNEKVGTNLEPIEFEE